MHKLKKKITMCRCQICSPYLRLLFVFTLGATCAQGVTIVTQLPV